MADKAFKKRGIIDSGAVKRKSVTVLRQELVKMDCSDPENSLPLVIQPAFEGVSLTVWAANNRKLLDQLLLEHGGIVFRRFDIKAVDHFESFVRTVSGPLMEYRERSSPRSRVRGNVYSSTDYPADQGIFLHCENSYSHAWPLKIFFFCAAPAQEGGETLIADCRKVFKRIPPDITRSFIDKEIMYVRNFSPGLGLDWQTVFQTRDRSAVEEYCREKHIHYEWKGSDQLRIRQVRPAVATHPVTGETLWFNHATFFNVSTLSRDVREGMLDELNENDLPNNTYYGDGSPIEGSYLDSLREAYRQETRLVSWQQGDVLMLDNMLIAHGRMPYRGSRRVLVAMTEPFISSC